ncbi:hypothetical protein Hanom_Chr09g00817491 [Helianthus anomalus]
MSMGESMSISLSMNTHVCMSINIKRVSSMCTSISIRHTNIGVGTNHKYCVYSVRWDIADFSI